MHAHLCSRPADVLRKFYGYPRLEPGGRYFSTSSNTFA